jgi:hypothetical protein
MNMWFLCAGCFPNPNKATTSSAASTFPAPSPRVASANMPPLVNSAAAATSSAPTPDAASVVTQTNHLSRGCCGLCFKAPPEVDEPRGADLGKPVLADRGQFSSMIAATAAVPDLPPGWKALQSRSRPDRMAFQNEFTGERISWVPTEPASTVRGEIRRSKRKSGKTRVGNSGSVGSQESDHTRNLPSMPGVGA